MLKTKNSLFCLWVILQRCFFIAVMSGLGYYAVAVNSQGRDLIVSLGESGLKKYFLLLQIALIIWSVTNWYSSRVLLTLTELRPYKKLGIEWWIRYVPRAFGIVPFIIVMVTFIFQKDQISAFWTPIAVLVMEMVVMIFLFAKRHKIAAKLSIQTYEAPYQAQKVSWDKLISIRSFKIFILSVLIGYLTMVILFLMPVSWKIAHWLMPGTILLLGLSGLTTFFSVLSYFNRWIKRPVFVLLILWVAFCALFNDNSELRLSDGEKSKLTANAFRPTIKEQFDGWVSYHAPLSADTIPLILVATQGGGIRALYWNNSVMTQLDTLYKGFTDHVFAISGVSGGGVGASFYLAYYRDFVLKGKRLSKKVDAFSSDEYLSAVTGGLFFSDNFQKFLPIPFPCLNRTRKLEDSWSVGYTDQTDLHTLDSSFLSLWDLPDSEKYRLPSLFLNGTLAETGQKTVLSNLELDHHFFDVIDVEDCLGGKDVPLKTGASLCSRFPIVTSGGLLCQDGVLPIGHIVDGGYAENTGIETALSLYESLREPILEHNRTNMAYQIVPVIIFLKNSKETKETNVITWFLDVRTVLSAFVSAWDRRAPVGNYLASDLLNELGKDSVYFSVELDRTTVKGSVELPLGWYLSEKAQSDIKMKAGKIQKLNKTLCARLAKLLN